MDGSFRRTRTFSLDVTFEYTDSGRFTTELTGRVLITGASSGVGLMYAHRFAARGHDLVLVARNASRLEKLATELRGRGVVVDVMSADLTKPEQRADVEARLRNDQSMDILVNNAGVAARGNTGNVDLSEWQNIIDVNVTAVARLAGAVIPSFLARHRGAIINISSISALTLENSFGLYNSSKSFVLAFSQSLQADVAALGIYVQAVLPPGTRTEIWSRSGRDVDAMPNLMSVETLVDAALNGFDQREAITIPSLHDLAKWHRFETARLSMGTHLRRRDPAARYTR